MEAAITMQLDATTDQNAQEEQRWVDESRSGDPGAFGKLVQKHQRRVFRLAGRFFKQRSDVEDAAQETFLRAWTKLDTYQKKAPFEHWITRICLNCCYERLRRPKGKEVDLEKSPEPLAPEIDPNAGMDIERILQHVSAEDRFVLLLLEGEGWSVREIAERLGWSSVNVKVRAHRARKRLRALMEKER